MHPLADNEWTVTAIGGLAVTATRPPDITFEADGAMHGFTGVNRMFGRYEIDGDQVTFGQAGTTMMAGPPDAMLLETAFLRAIGAGGIVVVSGDTATIGTGETQVDLQRVVPEPIAFVSGSVAYRERIAMPQGAVLTVSLLDVSRADAPADVLAKLVVPDPGNVPIDFELPYDPSVIDARHQYCVRATIAVDDRLWWTSDTAHVVPAADLAGAHATTVTIPLVRAGS